MTARVSILRGLQRLPTELQQKIFSQIGLPSRKDIEGVLISQTPWTPLAFSPVDELLIAFVHDGCKIVWFLNLDSHLEMGVRLRGHAFHLMCQAKKNRYGAFLKVWKIQEWTFDSTQEIQKYSSFPKRQRQPECSTVSCFYCKCLIHCPTESLDPWMDQCPDCLRMYGFQT